MDLLRLMTMLPGGIIETDLSKVWSHLKECLTASSKQSSVNVGLDNEPVVGRNSKW